MAAAVLESSSSFVYEDLVDHVETIRHGMIAMKSILDNRCKTKTSLLDELKTRSLIFIDPYGNHMNDKHFDHEFLINVINKYNKDYVPKYLQQWIEVGTMNDTMISSLNDFQLKSAVFNYENDFTFIAFGRITVWIGGSEYSSLHRVDLNVLLTDTMEKIKGRFAQYSAIQLRLCTINEGTNPNESHWNYGTILKSKETILSCQAFKNNRIIMGKFGIEGETDDTFIFSPPRVYLKISTKTTFFWVERSTDVRTLKDIIQEKEGIPADYQRLIYNGRQLEDGRTLSDYNISQGAVIYLAEHLRGGMYHITSGRQDFRYITYNGTKAVKRILKFKTKQPARARSYSSTKLQESILRSQDALSNFYRGVENEYFDEDIRDLKEIISPTNSDVEGSR